LAPRRADDADHERHHAPKASQAGARRPRTDRTRRGYPHPPAADIEAVNTAIDHLVTGDVKTIKEAAEKVGMPRESLSRALSTPHVAEHLRTKVLKYLAMAAARAGAVKNDLLDSDNAIARDRASSFILGLAGIQPATSPSVSVNLEIRAGYVIDLSEDPPPKVIPHV
jgi:hypothetical protein